MSDAVEAAKTSRLSGPIRGALWMIAAGTSFTAMLGVLRPATAHLHPFEVAFFRQLITLSLIMPWLLRNGVATMRTRRLPLIGLRALLGLASTLCWFYGVPHIPLAQSTAINFTSPLWATAFAAIILGETVRLRRWTATAIGFAGILIVLRPGFQEFSDFALIVLAGSAAWGSQHIVLKTLSRTERADVILGYHALLLTPIALLFALPFWITPSWTDLFWLALIGALGTSGHLCLTRSFAAADASVVLPFDFAKMPIATMIGFLAYGERPDLWTWVGAAVILTSSVYIARREAVLARRGERAATPSLRSDPPGTA
ncbi:MAG: DMT family transporter [Alphaproteobacteria bacterium]